MIEPLIDAKEVSGRVGLSVSTIYARMNAGYFPRPKRTGKNSDLWSESEIDDMNNAFLRALNS